MNIIDDLKILLSELKAKFNHEIPEVYDEKIIHDKKEFVLKTDIFSQDRLMEIAKKYHPAAEIISEELDNYHNFSKYTSSLVIMDPLDGTHNYLYGLPMWGISYTFFSKSREAIESYIGLPMLDMLIAFNNEEIIIHSISKINPVKIEQAKSIEKPLSEMMIAYDNQFNKDPLNMKENFNSLVDNVFTTRISGSAIFDIAMMVTGKLDARIWHSTEIYDVAPAYAFLKNSGEVLNLYNGKNASFDDKAIIASKDKGLFQQLKLIGFKGIEK